MGLVRAQEGNALFPLCLVGDSLPRVSHFYVLQAEPACLCSGLSFQGCFYTEQAWKKQSPDHGAGKLTAPYTKFGFSTLGALLP